MSRKLQRLRRYYVVNYTIFVHAGVDEEAGDRWEGGTDDVTFTEKYPAETGRFYMNIVAGHVGTAEISGDPQFHDIYFDGESHYYIDGTVLDSGVIPVIQFDTETNKFYGRGWLRPGRRKSVNSGLTHTLPLGKSSQKQSTACHGAYSPHSRTGIKKAAGLGHRGVIVNFHIEVYLVAVHSQADVHRMIISILR